MKTLTVDSQLSTNSELNASPRARSASAFRTKKEAKRYWILLVLFIGVGLLAALGLLL